jgi:nucleotide-binding universal stress UspA family protein
MIRRILVPLDGSRRAEQVLSHVVTVARVFNARVDLVHVLASEQARGFGAPADPFSTRMAKAHWSRLLESRAAELRSTGVKVWTRVEEGAPPTEIIDLLRKGSYDLVAMTAHGSGDDRRLRIGCTAASVILNANTGILLAPESGASPAPGSLQQAGYRRILAPVDCSPRGDWSLGVAAAIARNCGAALRVIHVLENPDIVSRLPDAGRLHVLASRLREENRTEASRYLDQVRWRFEQDDVPVEVNVVEGDGGVAEAILASTGNDDVDLVVLSAHGRGASPSWPLGGTAAKLVLWAQRPVLILQDQTSQSSGSGYRSRFTSKALAGEH